MIKATTACVLLPILGLSFVPEALPSRAQDPAPKVRPESASNARGWIEKLGSLDDRERERARQELEKLGGSALPELEKAAAESTDPEIRWNARKIARAIQDEVKRPERPTLERSSEAGSGVRPVEGSDGPGLRPLVPPGGLGGAGSSKSVQIGPGGVRVEITQEVDGKRETKVYEGESIDQLRREHPGLLDDVRVFGPGSADVPDFLGPQRDLFERLRVLDGKDGFPGLEKLFERELGPLGGPDLLQELDQHMRRMREEVGRLRPDGSAPGRPFDRNGEVAPGLEPDRGGSADGTRELPVAPLAWNERLGVTIEELHPEVARFLDLSSDVGLVVTTVQEGTLAEALGLAARDVLVAIEGRPIRGAETIRNSLREVPGDRPVHVEVLRFAEGRLKLQAVRPAGPAELGSPGAPRRLERR